LVVNGEYVQVQPEKEKKKKKKKGGEDWEASALAE
jgi:hypothetical protein